VRKQESTVLGIRMPIPKMQTLRARAAREGKSLSELGNELIDRALAAEATA
jgi:hypothetical protein